MIKYYKITLITSWLWFRYVHENVKTNNTKALIVQFHEKKIAKLWIVKTIIIENKIQCKKIKYQKTYRESFLDFKKDFFSIFNKINDISDMKALKYLLKEFSKLCIFLSISEMRFFFIKKNQLYESWILISSFLWWLLLLCITSMCVFCMSNWNSTNARKWFTNLSSNQKISWFWFVYFTSIFSNSICKVFVAMFISETSQC